MFLNVSFRKGTELKMATTGTLTGLKFLLNQVAFNKLVNKASSLITGLYFSNSIFYFAGE